MCKIHNIYGSTILRKWSFSLNGERRKIEDVNIKPKLNLPLANFHVVWGSEKEQ